MGATVMASGSSAPDRASAFLHAIVWGEHTRIWDLLSDDGRQLALRVATDNGLDRVVAGRIGQDLSDPTEREEFLRQLLRGLRQDLRSVDLPNLTVDTSPSDVDRETVSIAITSPSAIPGTEEWAAGRLVLSRDQTRGWCIDRLEPRLARP
ncbi:MAG: hypothetical protein OEV40_17810 [Acidimicrobiia bacterium]|nr:hypothetical protein [Acidimicrobiia bacterium]